MIAFGADALLTWLLLGLFLLQKRFSPYSNSLVDSRPQIPEKS